MRLADTLHSRIVAGLRLALPLAALAVLSTLFLFSRDIDPSRALPLAAIDAEDLARDPRITAPQVATVTLDGAAITLTAATLRITSGATETAAAEAVTVLFAATDGRISRLAADHARIDRIAEELTLQGNMVVETPAGYRVRSDALVVALDRSWAESLGPVTAEGPPGRLEAGRFVMRTTPGPDGAAPTHSLLFTDGVRLVYQPASGE